MLDILLAPESMSTSAFFVAIITIVAGVSGLAFGLFFKNTELAAMSAIVPLFVAIIWSFTSVVSKVLSYNRVLGLLVFAPMMFLFGMTIIEWWRGRD